MSRGGARKGAGRPRDHATNSDFLAIGEYVDQRIRWMLAMDKELEQRMAEKHMPKYQDEIDKHIEPERQRRRDHRSKLRKIINASKRRELTTAELEDFKRPYKMGISVGLLKDDVQFALREDQKLVPDDPGHDSDSLDLGPNPSRSVRFNITVKDMEIGQWNAMIAQAARDASLEFGRRVSPAQGAMYRRRYVAARKATLEVEHAPPVEFGPADGEFSARGALDNADEPTTVNFGLAAIKRG